MKNLVCNFAPLRFLPYREIGEFVNMGVVLSCPQGDFSDTEQTVPFQETAALRQLAEIGRAA